MARIVPAKPVAATRAPEAALLALEEGLDDSHVVFQRGFGPSILLVAHPERGICVLACLDETSRYDADAEVWSGADPDDIARALNSVLGAIEGVRPAVCAYLAATPRPGDATADSGIPIAFQGELDNLCALVARAMQSSGAPGIGAVDAIIAANSPNAAGYIRDWITEPQTRWRASRTQGAPEIAPSAPATNHADMAGGQHLPSTALPAPQAGADLARAPLPPGLGTIHKLTSDDPLLSLLRQAAETVVNGRSINVQGMEIDCQELVDPDFILPALLVAAAQDWAPVVVQRGGRGGFHVGLVSDPNAIVGYRVQSLEPSAPLLLLLPVVDRIRRAVETDVEGSERIMMDETLFAFARWLEANKLNKNEMDEIDLRIALQTTSD